ncbi:MAG: hypothetical protein N2544_16225, partial [Burkholderiales bacterium]|nr:hypothetical protein [Burkholderiales bacterium]
RHRLIRVGGAPRGAAKRPAAPVVWTTEMRAASLLLAIAALATGALAQPPSGLDATQWLQRIYAASRDLSFAGTFIYQPAS